MRSPSESDRGSASIEFIVVGVAIILPLIYIAITVLTLNAAQFASHQAASEGARAFVTSTSNSSGNQRASIAANQAFADYGLSESELEIAITCDHISCLTPGGSVSIEVSTQVPLPFVPHWGSTGPITMPITAKATLLVDQYREAGSS
jgi:Flp pilus assembly protein TadG